MNIDREKRRAEIITANLRKIDYVCGEVEVPKYTGERIVTPNLGLTIPAYAAVDWANDFSKNFLIIDRLLGGIGLEELDA